MDMGRATLRSSWQYTVFMFIVLRTIITFALSPPSFSLCLWTSFNWLFLGPLSVSFYTWVPIVSYLEFNKWKEHISTSIRGSVPIQGHCPHHWIDTGCSLCKCKYRVHPVNGNSIDADHTYGACSWQMVAAVALVYFPTVFHMCSLSNGFISYIYLLRLWTSWSRGSDHCPGGT